VGVADAVQGLKAWHDLAQHLGHEYPAVAFVLDLLHPRLEAVPAVGHQDFALVAHDFITKKLRKSIVFEAVVYNSRQ